MVNELPWLSDHIQYIVVHCLRHLIALIIASPAKCMVITGLYVAFDLLCITGGGGLKTHMHFNCVSHAKRGEEVQIECKSAFVIKGKPLSFRFYNICSTFC